MSVKHTVWTLDTVRSRCVEEGECWIWGQALNSCGYPQASVNGKNTRVQRFIFTDLLGKELPAGHVISQSCRNKACCAPDCQIAITYGQRLVRTYAEGRKSSVAERIGKREKLIAQGWPVKLDMQKAREIRSRVGETHAALAAEFKVHPKTIYEIRRNRSWTEAANGSSVFTWIAA